MRQVERETLPEEVTKITKLSFNLEGKQLRNNSEFLAEVREREFAGIQTSEQLEEAMVIGRVGETGVVVVSKGGEIIAALRHPNLIPREIDWNLKSVKFGGIPTSSMVEIPGQKRQGAKSSEIAKGILKALKENKLEIVLELTGGFAAVGVEVESWLIDPENGKLAPIDGGELQMGLLEETLPPIFNPDEFVRKLSSYIIERKKRFPDWINLDASVLFTSNPLEPQINSGQRLGPYIYAMQKLILERYAAGSDLLANKVFESILKKLGIEGDYEDVKMQKGDLGYWAMAASHASLGLPHLQGNDSRISVPTEIAICISDILNSDLATVAEFLMFSGPIIFGVDKIELGNKVKVWPRDYRAILRYLLDTANPAPFIMAPEEMSRRIINAITHGLTHTIDRASYLTSINGRLVPVMHGRVRNRQVFFDNQNLTGRIEFTGCSASPSILDETARNCFLQILAVAALEALKNGKRPMEYWGEDFPYIATWQNQKELVQYASLYGFGNPIIEPVIKQSIEFIEAVIERYKVLTPQGRIAISRIENLLADPVDSLEDYLENPQGPISEVMQKEVWEKGYTALELAKAVEGYRLKSALSFLT